MMCKVENNLPDNNWWNRVLTDGDKEMDTPAGRFPNLSMSYVTLACQQCSRAPCVEACPTGATHKREMDGIVMQDIDECIGCRSCIEACPYDGVRLFNSEKPSYQVDFAVGDVDVAAHREHTVEKCTFCVHRLAKGLEPACIDVCTARARHFGDLNDPEGRVSMLLKRRDYFQLLPEEMTDPSIYFLSGRFCSERMGRKAAQSRDSRSANAMRLQPCQDGSCAGLQEGDR
jgi:molybdopterin-containing oxidoreductase family iron-sulfur binding subunit